MASGLALPLTVVTGRWPRGFSSAMTRSFSPPFQVAKSTRFSSKSILLAIMYNLNMSLAWAQDGHDAATLQSWRLDAWQVGMMYTCD